MQIVFGWGYDGARWSDRDSLRRYVTGPTGLTSLIATCLGLTTPDVSLVHRIAAYHRVLERHVADAARAPWLAESFAKDPWARPRQVLSWRDELIGAGWNADDDASATMPPRLRTLARIETILSDEPSWSAGSADVLRDVAAELEWLVSSKVPYSLGFETVTLEHARSELPQI